MIKVKKLLEMKGSDICSVGPDSSVFDDEHTTLGMVSIGDMAKEIIGQQKSQIHNLEHYVNWAERY